MANLTGSARASYVRTMFGRIARRYDLMNTLMTLGQDRHWRKRLVRHAGFQPGGWLLDLGAGTGDLAWSALQREPTLHVYAADFTIEMMLVGKSRFSTQPGEKISWLGADATRLPFPEMQFDVVVSGFLLRNLGDLPRCLAEQFRILKQGGRIVALETSPPPRTLIRPLLEFHMHRVIPWLGRLIAGQADAYSYLPDSTERFLEPEQLSKRIAEAGFSDVGFERHMLGTIAIHWGTKR
jgi:demethylmenaquinone methyltransferase / 2-methoxy-6-polyprenyl-1,4-benzoquinol methylase